MKKGVLKYHAAAFFTVFVWGITFVSTKYLEGALSSLEILFIRYIIAYTTLWILCPERPTVCGAKQEGYLFVAALSGAALYQYLENVAVEYTSPASVSFITATAPIFTALLASRLLGEKLTAKIFIGMLISLVGVFFICFGDSRTLETGLTGDLIIFFSIWLWAVYSILVKKISEFGISRFQVTRRLFFYSLVVMLPFMIFGNHGEALRHLKSISIAGNLLFLGVFASAICFAGWNMSVEKLGATTTSRYLFLSPLVTLVAQSVYNRSIIGGAALVGMAVTLVGIAVSEFKFKPKTAENAAKEKKVA